MIDFNGDVWQTLQVAITAKCCTQDQNEQKHRGDYLLKGEHAKSGVGVYRNQLAFRFVAKA